MATYVELGALRTDAEFHSRTAVAVCLHADMVIHDAVANPPAPAPQPDPEAPVLTPLAPRLIAPRVNWAMNALRNPDEQVYRIMGSLLANDEVQVALGAITDDRLQAVVAAALELQMDALI